MMNSFWIILVGILLIFGNYSNGQSDIEVEVELITKKFVEKGSSILLHCKHNIELGRLYKVSWHKNGQKVFEFINGRDPPFRNFTVTGSEIDFTRSNDHDLVLKSLDYDATGLYSCEASLESPIFTKESKETQIMVILPQNSPPVIEFEKKQFYVGEKLKANCSTSRARPIPHITWLLNGKKVEEIYTRTLHPHNSLKNKLKSHYDMNEFAEHPNENGKNPKDVTEISDYTEDHNRFSVHGGRQQPISGSGTFVDNFESTDTSLLHKSHNNLYRNQESNYHDNKNFDTHKKHRNGLNNKKYRRHANEHQKHVAATRRKHPETFSSSQISIEVSELHFDQNGRLELTCVSTIPASVGPDEQYADYKTTSVKIDVEPAEPTTQLPQSAGMAALGNKSNKVFSLKYPLELLIQCLPMIIIALVNS